MLYRIRWPLTGLSMMALAAVQAQAQTGSEPVDEVRTEETSRQGGIDEIIVTANKRAQSVNSVGMSINALSSDMLEQRGIGDVADLAKVVPGLTFAQSAYSTPVYTLRGVGLYEAGFVSSPAVSVYVDEVPLAFPIMTSGAGLDLERVEVLKGPQGILFGQNSTGGAINYVAAKPQDRLGAGVSLTVARFGAVELKGHVTGPLSDTLRFRLAGKVEQGGAWQKSQTRPRDRLGDADRVFGRLLLDWEPTDRLSIRLNLNGFIDNSDTQAGQFDGPTIQAPGADALNPEILTAPVAPRNARAADWNADWPHSSRNRFGQAAIRVEYAISDTATLTSISSLQRMKIDSYNDGDGTAFDSLSLRHYGKIRSFNQELRLAGSNDRLDWLVGASYEKVTSDDNILYDVVGTSTVGPIPGLPYLTDVISSLDNKQRTYAAFGNLEVRLNDQLSLIAGGRYTRNEQEATNCTTDPTAQNAGGQIFEILQGVFGRQGATVPIGPGQCYTLNPSDDFAPGAYATDLRQNNTSFRAGINYKPDNGGLLYANFTRGFKAGAYSNISAALAVQYVPAVQERVDAWEAGFKLPLFDRRLQLNAAAFYYDYKDKQVRTKVLDAVFQNIERLVNVPKSRIWGLEGEFQAQPFDGLNLSGGVTYLDSRVSGSFLAYNQAGELGDFKGSVLPYTPKWQASGDVQYGWAVGASNRATLGAGVTYNSAANATFGTQSLPADTYDLKSYALLDLRAGFGAADGAWEISLFGRNITNSYYVTTLFQSDTRFRYAGRPATYGVTFSIRTR